MLKQDQKTIIIEQDAGQFSDWSALLSLIQVAFKSMESRIDPPSSMHKLTAQILKQKACDETLIFACSGSELVGCAFACDIGKALYIGKVSVSPDFQGYGIGAALMEECGRLAERLGKTDLELQTRVELIENRRFFEKLGFIKTSDTAHEGFTRPTSITMRRKVDKNEN